MYSYVKTENDEMKNIVLKINCCINRKEGNAQESTQIPNTFRPRHQRERRSRYTQQITYSAIMGVPLYLISFPVQCMY